MFGKSFLWVCVKSLAVNERPDLFGSLSFLVAKLDVMNDLDPVKFKNEWQENGNPNIKEEFEYMLGYSPYQNVKKQAYPPMQFITGLNDKNVPPYETIKMVAKLKANQTNSAPIYLTADTKGNHYFFNVHKMVYPYVFKLAIHHNILP